MTNQSWQHMPLLPAVSAPLNKNRTAHHEVPWGPPVAAEICFVLFFFFNFTAVKGNQIYANVYNTTFANSGAWIWGWYCLLVQSFQRMRLTFLFHPQAGMQLWHSLHPDIHQHFRNHEGQHVTLSRDEYKVLVFCWVFRQTANITPFLLNNVWC